MTLLQRCGSGVVLALLLLSGAWCAPDSATTWPSENDLLAAVTKGVNDQSRPLGRIWIRGIHEITVGKTERGWLVSVWLPDQGRNFSARTFLYRPNLKQAKELNYSRSLGLVDVTGHYGQIALLEGYESGQGGEHIMNALVRFTGWTLRELHRVEFSNNLGACGSSSSSNPPSECEQTRVNLQLIPDQGDDLHLIEITTHIFGADLRTASSEVISRRLRLVGDRFKPIGH